MEQIKTPIVLLIFNRPQYTEKVLAKIKKVRPQKLYVVADGARNDGEWEKCNAARKIIENIDWECEVYKNYADTNMGLEDRVSSGISWVFEHEERAIILEDDCLPDLTFFEFAEEMLQRYNDDDRIMMVSGSNPVDTYTIKDSYVFSRYFSIWGWATWKRAWGKYDPLMKEWPTLKTEQQLESFYTHKEFLYYINSLFDDVYSGKTKSWATRWFYSCLINNGLTIVPKSNLVSNIGTEGTNTSGKNNNVPIQPINMTDIKKPHLVFPDHNYENAFFDRSFPPPPKATVKSIVIKKLVKIKQFLKKLPI